MFITTSKTAKRQQGIEYLQNGHFNNLAMYTVQRIEHKLTSFANKKRKKTSPEHAPSLPLAIT